MFNDLIKYEDLQEACAETFGFSHVTMLRDFGPLKAGQKIDSLWFQLETGLVEVYEAEPKWKKVLEFKFGLVAL